MRQPGVAAHLIYDSRHSFWWYPVAECSLMSCFSHIPFLHSVLIMIPLLQTLHFLNFWSIGGSLLSSLAFQRSVAETWMSFLRACCVLSSAKSARIYSLRLYFVWFMSYCFRISVFWTCLFGILTDVFMIAFGGFWPFDLVMRICFCDMHPVWSSQLAVLFLALFLCHPKFSRFALLYQRFDLEKSPEKHT